MNNIINEKWLGKRWESDSNQKHVDIDLEFVATLQICIEILTMSGASRRELVENCKISVGARRIIVKIQRISIARFKVVWNVRGYPALRSNTVSKICGCLPRRGRILSDGNAFVWHRGRHDVWSILAAVRFSSLAWSFVIHNIIHA